MTTVGEDRPAYTRAVATDERPHVASEPLAKDASVTGGNGNGNGRVPERAAVIAGPVPAASPRRRRPAARPAPAVPLVPPSRPSTRPIAPTPIARTGTDDLVAVHRPRPRRRSPSPRCGRRSPARPPVRVRMARRPRVRKVNRIVRRVDAWSVFKIALVFWAVTLVIFLVAGLLLWNLAESTGTLTNIEGFIKELFGLKTFEFDGSKVFRASWMIGAVLVVAMTAMTVTMAVLFNLISDLLGGVRVTVLEEEVVLRRAPTAVAAPAPRAVRPTPPAPTAADGVTDFPRHDRAGYRRAAPGAIAQSVRAHP